MLALETTEPTGAVVFACQTGAEGEDVVCPGAEVAVDGTYTIADLAAGSYDVFARPPSSRTDVGVSGTVVVELEAGADVTGVNLTFTLVAPEPELSSLTGTVHDHTGGEVPGATVEACSLSVSAEAIVIDEGRTGCPTVTTNEAGAFSFSLPSGNYSVQATFEELSASATVTVPTEAPLLLALPAPPTGDIFGVVQDSSEAPVPGVTVTALGRTGTTFTSDPTDGNGRFELIDLPYDTYAISAPSTQTETQAVDATTAELKIFITLFVADSDPIEPIDTIDGGFDETSPVLVTELALAQRSSVPPATASRQPQHFGVAPEPAPPPAPPRQPQHFGSAPEVEPEPIPAAESPPPPPRQAQAFGTSEPTPTAQSPAPPPPRQPQAFGSPPTPP